MEMIRPSADLRNRYSEISKECRENRQPISITVNGREDTVIMGAQDYRQMAAELNLLRMLAEAEDDAAHGRTAPIEDTFSGIRKSLQERQMK